MPWTRFWWDSNRAFGFVESPAEWRAIVWRFGDPAWRPNLTVSELLEAKQAAYRTGEDVPSFGFRVEHTGDLTLGEWAKQQGMDLTAVEE